MVAMNIGEVLPQVGRKWRRPKHTFQLINLPYLIQPCMLAPVLPGETLKQLLVQSRVVSDPVKHPLIGWWQEYYFFYVKHRDLAERDLLVNMMLDPATDTSTLNTSASPVSYHFGGAPDWTAKCLQTVTEHYFRDEDEAWNTSAGLITGWPMAHALSAGENWMDTLVVDASMPDADPNDLSFQALEPQQAQWEYLRAMKLTDMTYEQWLGTYGVNVGSPGEAHKPELIRYLREWSYPTNTVEPTTGAPSSALSWSVAERADKDRFFREPGWVFGCSVTRPKVYFKNVAGSAASLMKDGMSWLPAIMKDQPGRPSSRFRLALVLFLASRMSEATGSISATSSCTGTSSSTSPCRTPLSATW